MNDNNLTPQIDELLWAAAESKDPSLRQQFEERYPHLRAQLATRIAMVDVLRRSKPVGVMAPGFRSPSPAFARLWLVPAGAILLAALAFGAYELTSYLAVTQSPIAPDTVTEQPPLNQQPPVAETFKGPAEPSDIPIEDPSKLGTAPRPSVTKAAPMVAVSTKKLTLFKAISEIEKQGNLKFQIMPGVKDMALDIPPNRPDGSVVLSPTDMLSAVEKLAPIHLVDGGPDGWLILPMDKVSNVEPNSEQVSKGVKSSGG